MTLTLQPGPKEMIVAPRDHAECCPAPGPRWPPAAVRFHDKVAVDADTGCWVWTGGRKKAGYGQFVVGGRKVIAHRWSYRHFVGPIPDTYEIDHLCRNKSCVNSMHLEPVSLSVNRERRNAAKTHCNRDHLYDEANTRWGIDTRGYRNRFCRKCDSIRNRQAKERRAAR